MPAPRPIRSRRKAAADASWIEDALSIAQTADVLGVSTKTVYRLCDSGQLETRYLVSRRFVIRASLDAFIAAAPRVG